MALSSILDWLSGGPLKTQKAGSKKEPEQTRPIYTPVDPLLDDIDRAEAAVTGAINTDLRVVAELIRAALKDSYASSLLSVRTAGLCTLPALYEGGARQVAKLSDPEDATVDGFTRYFSRQEQALFVADTITMGVGVANILPDKFTGEKIVVRRTPDHLSIRGAQWFYGNFPITPGDGQWVVGSKGLERPWLQGAWRAMCRETTKKMLGEYNRLAFVNALANAISLIHAPLGANSEDLQDAMLAWAELGTNNVKGLPAGWDAKLLEVQSGVGSAAFDKVVSDACEAIAMIICGQSVTSQGSAGSGFINVKYFDAIRRDHIIADAALLDTVIDQQIMPHLFPGVTRRIDLTDDNQKTVAAQRLIQASAAISALSLLFGDQLDGSQLVKDFAIPLKRGITEVKITPPPAPTLPTGVSGAPPKKAAA